MDQTILVGFDVDGGKRLIAALDDAGYVVDSAMWLYLPESDSWRLVLASPCYDESGPIAAYTRVLQVLRNLTPELQFGLSDVSLVGRNDTLFQALGSLTRAEGGLSNTRLRRISANGLYVQDAFIYRLRRPPAPNSRAKRRGRAPASVNPHTTAATRPK